MDKALITATARRAADWWGARLKTEDPAPFTLDLQSRIERALESEGRVHIENDYDPQGILLESVHATVDPECRGFMFSGDGLFPRKHSTTIKPGEIHPKEGYGNWGDVITIDLQ